MASARPNHLTAEEVCQYLLFKAVSDIEYATLVDASFRRLLHLAAVRNEA